MMRFIIQFWLILSASLFAPFVWAAQSDAVDTGKVLAQLVSTHDSVMPGETFHVALKTTLDDHWHTYWRNPGESGEPVQIQWTHADSLSAGDITWPLPDTIATGPIINYGFEGVPYFPVEFTLSRDALIGESLEISANVYYLVCYDVCIPEQAELNLFITVGETQTDVLNKAGIDNAVLDAPKRGAAKGGIELSGTDVTMTVNGLPEGVDLSEAYFFPNDQGYIIPSAPQGVSVGSNGVTLKTQADYLWEDGAPETLEGVIRYKRDGIWNGEIVTLNVGQAVSVGQLTTPPGEHPVGGAFKLNIITALIGAFIGGLILNLMPCVFPVISMKALSIAKAAHDDVKIIRRNAWFYTFGVIATFLLLTIILLGLKAAGSQIGWGFQLQSPVLVGFLALLLFAIGLNLLGMFEIGSGLQNFGSETATGGGAKGAFFTGALAVIVATPCTAPFMAGAVGYALAQPALVTLIIFFALAVGFALPFLLIAYVPSILRRLPKPGLWMVRFKELLSFPMFAAAIWLVWVATQQSGDMGLLCVLSAMFLLALAVWLFKSPKALVKGIAIITLIGAVSLPISLKTVSGQKVLNKAEYSVPWSPAAVQTAQAEGKTIFVDFTAAWCVTCKVNERLVLSLPDVQARLSDDDVVFMIADWTNKNDIIAQELARHGRSGVPLYLVYNPNNNSVTAEVLPQILTQNMVLAALE